MTNQDRNKAWGFTLFGDDIRAEVGGKLSLMGMYQGDMFFPSNMALPFLIPKLAVSRPYQKKNAVFLTATASSSIKRADMSSSQSSLS